MNKIGMSGLLRMK